VAVNKASPSPPPAIQEIANGSKAETSPGPPATKRDVRSPTKTVQSTARLALAPDRFKSFWQTGRSGLAADYASGGQPQTATSMERDMVMAAIASEIGGT
jgi:hypothetical protein